MRINLMQKLLYSIHCSKPPVISMLTKDVIQKLSNSTPLITTTIKKCEKGKVGG
jgi:hypothetical protein